LKNATQLLSSHLAHLLPTRGGVPYYRVEEFLLATSADEILDDLLARRDEFCSLTGPRNFLRLPSPLDQVPRFSEKLSKTLPTIERRFRLDLSHPQLELYVHAYNHGTYFDKHPDNHGGANWRRRVSCVYYLHQRPRRFDGGRLLIYDSKGRAFPVESVHNSIVFFPSSLVHEVLPIQCASRRFEDSRFAINVWVC
jgi:SM-20-related protein